MYNVIVVDDEPVILKGIEKLVNCEGPDFKVIASTISPGVAFELICRLQPDVVLTDIRMPEINGIELIKKVRQKDINTEFIIISGFSDFSYARGAILQGALDYVLKPLNRNTIKETLNRVHEYLDKKYKDGDFQRIENIVDSGILMGEYFTKSFFDVIFTGYMVIMADNDHIYRSVLTNCEKMTSIIKLRIGRNRYLYMVNGENALLERLAIDISISVQSDGNDDLNVGIFLTEDPYVRLTDAIKKADIAYYTKFICRQNGVYSYVEFDRNFVTQIFYDIKQLIPERNRKLLYDYIDSIPRKMHENGYSIDALIFLWNQLVSYMQRKTEGLSSSSEYDYMNYDYFIQKFDSHLEYCQGVRELIVAGSYCLPNDKEIKYDSESFESILKYIHENYKENITLGSLAEKFFFSMNYFCTFFREQTGESFSRYITRLKMQKAAELLENCSIAISDVCYLSGYNDYFYFNKVFKKQYGITPSEYRNRGGKHEVD